MPVNTENHDKFYGLKPEIANEIKVYEAQYFREDKPIPFNNKWMVYPALMHDYETFANSSTCLTLNKNEDPKGIRMNHLEYLLSKTQLPGEEGVMWLYKIQKLCEICLHVKTGVKCVDCGTVIEYSSDQFKQWVKELQNMQKEQLEKKTDDGKPPQVPKLLCPNCGKDKYIETIKIIQDQETNKLKLMVDGQEVTKQDFERLRQIILYQNFPDYQDDSWVDPEIKKDYEERMRLERKQNDVHATLEEKIVCLAVATGFRFQDIYDMSIRKFTMSLQRVDDLINYKIMKQAVSSGFAQLPKGKNIEHWIYKPDRDMYGDAYKSTDDIKGELSKI